jgi:hypothetical protein
MFPFLSRRRAHSQWWSGRVNSQNDL